ncbi:MAG: IS481 family transposase [Zoogloeaceae bacterium]|nr:IS481 family transposase [Zoogloeaceae bacterium]
MNAEAKVAKQRLSVLELAEVLGNVSEACRRRGMTRTQFYEFKRRFQTQGLEGLKDLPPIPKSHPMATPPELVEQVLALALKHPAYGCNKLEALLMAQGKRLSNVTIQKILIEHRLGSRYERWLALEQKNAEQAIELTVEQIAFIEKSNPCFRERHVESARPGELLSQDTFFVGVFKGVGKVYMHTVVDTFSSHAFGFLHISKQPEAAVAVLHNDVLPFYKKLRLPVGAVLTDNGREFCGTENHPFELYLDLNDIEHRRTRVKRPQTNGFVERFHRTALDEFYRVALREKVYLSVEALQEDLDHWLRHYNRERPHLGYRNNGRTPFETVQTFVKPHVQQVA